MRVENKKFIISINRVEYLALQARENMANASFS